MSKYHQSSVESDEVSANEESCIINPSLFIQNTQMNPMKRSSKDLRDETLKSGSGSKFLN